MSAQPSAQPSASSATSHLQQNLEASTKGNDTQSNSSGGSSVSMLEETQAAEGDGYKTPNTFEQCNIAGGQMNDQFALVLLRLQHGLDETVGRLERLEDLVKESLNGLRSLQNQTQPKQRLSSIDASRGKHITVASCSRKLINIVKHLGAVHFFYLSYPIVAYMILGALERRRRNRQPLW